MPMIFRLSFFRNDKTTDPKLKVILADEASFMAMSDIVGRWPWPRAIWADLLDYLSQGGARSVLFDILFTERQDEINDKALIDATTASQKRVSLQYNPTGGAGPGREEQRGPEPTHAGRIREPVCDTKYHRCS